jgi:hypothetical protein
MEKFSVYYRYQILHAKILKKVLNKKNTPKSFNIKRFSGKNWSVKYLMLLKN